jgi:signal transduction histidine kinase
MNSENDKNTSPTDIDSAMQLAHEIRTSLLSASYIFQDLLKKYSDVLSPGDQKLLQIGIETNAVKIAYAGEFLERLHGLPSRLERENFTLGSFQKMLVQIIRLYEARAKEKDIAFIEDVRLNDSVEADFNKTQMSIVIGALLDNAIKYSLIDPRKVSVIAENDERSLFISVTDTGIGIPGSEKSRIFERFFRAKNAREHDGREGGVGLYLCQQYIAAEGGTLTFESTENKGSTFSLSIPLIRRKVRS